MDQAECDRGFQHVSESNAILVLTSHSVVKAVDSYPILFIRWSMFLVILARLVAYFRSGYRGIKRDLLVLVLTALAVLDIWMWFENISLIVLFNLVQFLIYHRPEWTRVQMRDSQPVELGFWSLDSIYIKMFRNLLIKLIIIWLFFLGMYLLATNTMIGEVFFLGFIRVYFWEEVSGIAVVLLCWYVSFRLRPLGETDSP